MILVWTEDIAKAGIPVNEVEDLFIEVKRNQKEDWMPSVDMLVKEWDRREGLKCSELVPTIHAIEGKRSADDEAEAIRVFQERERQRREARNQFLLQSGAPSEALALPDDTAAYADEPIAPQLKELMAANTPSVPEPVTEVAKRVIPHRSGAEYLAELRKKELPPEIAEAVTNPASVAPSALSDVWD